VPESRPSAAEVESARREWEDGHRRLVAEARDRAAGDALMAQVEAVLDELRRRVGGTYTLAELAAAYARAESWSREVVAERAPRPDWPRTLSTVEAAAFHLYARGASDYEP
jgi:glutathione S-transferase